jgi:hypothetical protein
VSNETRHDPLYLDDPAPGGGQRPGNVIPNYRLDWFTIMTGGGGGPASSATYAANFTVGQTVIGTSASENYGSGLGYWYGLLDNILRNLLPLVTKN